VNITLSVDDELVARVRNIARQQGTSLNELVRLYLRTVSGGMDGDSTAQALERLWTESPGRSGGYTFRRDDAYEDPT